MKRAIVNQVPLPGLQTIGGIGGTTPDGTDEWVSNPVVMTSIWVPVMTEDVGTGLWYVVVTGDGDAVMTEVPL